jgi:hypothetical protein
MLKLGSRALAARFQWRRVGMDARVKPAHDE